MGKQLYKEPHDDWIPSVSFVIMSLLTCITAIVLRVTRQKECGSRKGQKLWDFNKQSKSATVESP